MCLVRALKLLLLAVALFGAEVGESAYFVDDTSNDYIQTPASSVGQLAKRAPEHPIFQGSFQVPEELTRKLAVIPSCEASRSSAQTSYDCFPFSGNNSSFHLASAGTSVVVTRIAAESRHSVTGRFLGKIRWLVSARFPLPTHPQRDEGNEN